MKEYFLKAQSDLNLNGGYLSVFENNIETVLISEIKVATRKGWKSKKPIFEKIEILFKESETDFIISEKSAFNLLDKYQGINTKVFTKNNGDQKAYVILELCKHITDIHCTR
jgi:hypothetical protein